MQGVASRVDSDAVESLFAVNQGLTGDPVRGQLRKLGLIGLVRVIELGPIDCAVKVVHFGRVCGVHVARLASKARLELVALL